MKERKRIFAMLLSLILVFTFMPAMAFADEGVPEEAPVSGEVAEASEGAASNASEKADVSAPDATEDAEAEANGTDETVPAEEDEEVAEPEESGEAGSNTVSSPTQVVSKDAMDAVLPFDGGESDTEITFLNDDGIEQTAFRTPEGLAYTLVNSDGLDSVRVIGYNGGGNTINVPAELGGHVVSGFSIDPEKPIDDSESYDGIKHINLPDSVIYFRTSNLEKFTALESIGGLDGQEMNGEKYKTADGVLYRYNSYGDLRLQYYPPEKKSTSWVIEPDVVNWYSFDRVNPYLESITLPANGGVYDFYNLTNLKEILVSEDSENYTSVDGVLYSDSMRYLVAYPAAKEGKTFQIPDSVEEVNYDAFMVESGSTEIEELYLPTGIDLNEFGWWGLLENCREYLKNLRKIVFTDPVAPALDEQNMWNFTEFYKTAVSEGIEFSGPEDGTGYDEFFYDLNNHGLAPIPDEPVNLQVDTPEDIQIQPEQVVTFAFKPSETANYSFEIKSDNEFNYDSCILEDGQEYDSFVVSGSELYQQYENEQNYYANTTGQNCLANKTYYLQIKSNNSDTASITVTPSRCGSAYLADIPDDCEELENGVAKTGEITDQNEVVTYKFTIPERDPDYSSQWYDANVTITRSSEHDEQLYFNHALIDPDQSGYFGIAYPDYSADELSGQWSSSLECGKTYYIQIQPGVSGPYSVQIDYTWHGYNEDDDDEPGEEDYGFEEVPADPEAVDPIAVNEEKTLEVTENETFTFAFRPDRDGDYTFESLGQSDTVCRVIVDDQVIVQNDDSSAGGDGYNFGASFHAVAGKTYYLQAKLLNAIEEEGATETFRVRLIEYIAEHQHTPEKVDAVPGKSEDEPGTIEHWVCTTCGIKFKDEACRHRAYDEDLIVPYGDLIVGFEFIHQSDLTGYIGEDYINGNEFYEPGNEIVVTYDDGNEQRFRCIDIENGDEVYVGYFLNGDPEAEELYPDQRVLNEDGVLVEGENEVSIIATINGQKVSTVVTVTATEEAPVEPEVNYGTPVSAEFTLGDGNKPLWGYTGNNYLENLYEDGNKFTVTFEDGDEATREFVCVVTPDPEGGNSVGFFENGDVDNRQVYPAEEVADGVYFVTGENNVRMQLSMAQDEEEAAAETPFYADLVVNGVDPEHEHEAGEPVIENEIAGTCSTEGSYESVVYCTICGEELSCETVVTGYDDNNHNLAEPVEENRTEATCSKEGSYDMVVYCNDCGDEISRRNYTIEKKPHSWSEPVYEWAADNSTVTARRSCSDPNHEGGDETETVSVSSTVTKPATCEEPGETTYTSAEFENPAFSAQSKTLEDLTPQGHTLNHIAAVAAKCETAGNKEYWECEVCHKLFSDEACTAETSLEAVTEAPLEHQWGEVTYSPSEEAFDPETDGETVTASRACTREGCDATESETKAFTKTTDAASCTAPGTVTYTAVFDNEIFGTWTTTRNVGSVDHSWSEVTYTWNADHSKVTASRSCTNPNHNESVDGPKTQTETVNATGEITTQPTCTKKGKTTYTSAAFSNPAFTVQSVEVEDVAKKGHDWGEPAYEWSADNTSVTASRTCNCEYHDAAVDGPKTETETVGVTATTTKEPTCTEKGEKTYTSASFTNSAFSVQTKTEEDEEATGHVWDDGTITKRATVDEEGELTYTCTLCGAVNPEKGVIPKLEPEHEAVNHDAEAAVQHAEDLLEGNDAAAASAAADEAVTEADSAFEEAVTAVANANKDLARAEVALENATSEADREAAQAAVDAAQAAVNAATQELADANATQKRAVAAQTRAKSKISSSSAAAAVSAAASRASEGTDASVAAAQAAKDAAAQALKDAESAKSAAEEALAAAEATKDSTAIAAAQSALTAAESDLSAARTNATAADATLGTAITKRDAAVAAANAADKAAADKAAAEKAEADRKAAEFAANGYGYIDPTLPKVKIQKPKAAKKSFTAKWKKLKKKQLKVVKGIEVEYSLTPDFQNPVFKSTSKKKANLKIKKLTSKKTYYVRAHTYVIRNGVKYVSYWSAGKKVKVK